jgi:glycine/D-amino acid oxidase-like deaminating enzyme
VKAIVVGGGAYGTSCATRLAASGAEVVLLERSTPGHARAASGGITRVLRFEYGLEARYTSMTMTAVERWRELERRSGATLLEQCGVLHLAVGEGAWERRSFETVTAAGCRAELLEPGEVGARWPAFDLAGVTFALYSPDGGFLWARRATELLGAVARDIGVDVRSGVEVREAADGAVTTVEGERLTADVVVLCTGSWSSGLDERLGPIVPRRQVTVYLDGDIGDAPVFGDGGLDFYGFPRLPGCGVKIGWHRTRDGDVGDPSDESLRTASDRDLAPLIEYAGRRFPGLAGVHVLDSDICFYAMTADEHPIVDRLDERTVVCAGLSGHGFKFSPVLGAAAAELALGLEPSVDLRGFELSRPALSA